MASHLLRSGGRHNLVLALPDNSDSDRAQRTQCSPVSHRPQHMTVLYMNCIGVTPNWLLVYVKQAVASQTSKRLWRWCLQKPKG